MDTRRLRSLVHLTADGFRNNFSAVFFLAQVAENISRERRKFSFLLNASTAFAFEKTFCERPQGALVRRDTILIT